MSRKTPPSTLSTQIWTKSGAAAVPQWIFAQANTRPLTSASPYTLSFDFKLFAYAYSVLYFLKLYLT